VGEQTLESQWGREPLTVGSEIPTVALRDILGRVHVGTPDDRVMEMIEERLDRIGGYTAEQRAQTLQAAVWLHHENLAEYMTVMSGRF
jgi:hypothetical protein